jgi:hypothetical protein
MVVFVVILNVLIGLVCLAVAFVVWMLRRKVASASDKILSVERSVYRVLNPAPPKIEKARRGSQSARAKYLKLEMQTQKMQQIVAMLSVGRGFWMRRAAVSRTVSRGGAVPRVNK